VRFCYVLYTFQPICLTHLCGRKVRITVQKYHFFLSAIDEYGIARIVMDLFPTSAELLSSLEICFYMAWWRWCSKCQRIVYLTLLSLSFLAFHLFYQSERENHRSHAKLNDCHITKYLWHWQSSLVSKQTKTISVEIIIFRRLYYFLELLHFFKFSNCNVMKIIV